jgi:hypothetical protein
MRGIELRNKKKKAEEKKGRVRVDIESGRRVRGKERMVEGEATYFCRHCGTKHNS